MKLRIQVNVRGKGLEGLASFYDFYPLSIEGSGYFSSSEIHCERCCEKHRRDGRITCYHQLPGAVLIDPGYEAVFC